jgi:hypothetical protein
MIAPTSPIPWLIPFASSSPVDCVHLGKASGSARAFIAGIMQRASSNLQFEISGSAQRLGKRCNPPQTNLPSS